MDTYGWQGCPGWEHPRRCARIEEQDITFADINTRPGDSPIDIGSIDRGAGLFVRDIDAGGITIEQVE